MVMLLLANSNRCEFPQVIQQGAISAHPPLGSVSEAKLRASEVPEGATVSIPQQVTCSVAFARGQERSVLITVHGMPQVCSSVLTLLQQAFILLSRHATEPHAHPASPCCYLVCCAVHRHGSDPADQAMCLVNCKRAQHMQRVQKLLLRVLHHKYRV